jgi:hypothetical protein
VIKIKLQLVILRDSGSPIFSIAKKKKAIDTLTVLLHNRQELDDNLGRGTNENLSLTTAFGVVDVVQTIVQDGDSDHI